MKALRVWEVVSITSLLACTSSHESAVTTVVVGPEGGALELEDGFRLSLPPGALQGEVEISVERLSESPTMALGPTYLLGPEGLQFDLPVSLHLPMPPASLPADTQLMLAVQTAPAGSILYEELEVTASSSEFVETTTTHFSIFFSSGAQPVVLTSEERYSRFIACDGQYVYWTSGGNGDNQLPHTNRGLVFRSPRAGGPIEVLSDPQEDPVGIDVDDSHVFWATGGRGVDDPLGQVKSTIMRADKDGSNPLLLAEVAYPSALMVEDATVYWTDNDLGEVQSVPKAGGDVTTLASGQGYDLHYLAQDGQHIYWSTGTTGTVARVPTQGGTVETLVQDGGNAKGLAVWQGEVYWADQLSGWVRSVPVTGGSPTNVRLLDQPAALAIVDGVAYATDLAGGYVYRWELGQSDALILATGLAFPKELELEAGSLVWSSEGFDHFQGTVEVFDLVGHGL